MYFQKGKVIEDSESEQEEKPRVYKVIKAYHDEVIAKGKGNQIITEKISAGQLATNKKTLAWSDDSEQSEGNEKR